MSYEGHIPYKCVKLILTILNGILEEERHSLKKMNVDKKCPIEIYEKTLDKCKEIEYAIQNMEKFL
tara:strand:- start:351 stop:548 length:198 start_codon:yes stop_codon:yes gene_type:complete